MPTPLHQSFLEDIESTIDLAKIRIFSDYLKENAFWEELYVRGLLLAAPNSISYRILLTQYLRESGQTLLAEAIEASALSVYLNNTTNLPQPALAMFLNAYVFDSVLEDIGRGKVNVSCAKTCDWHTLFSHTAPNTWSHKLGFVSELTCEEAFWFYKGPEIVARYPIEKVTLGDRRPLRISGLGTWVWVLRINGSAYSASQVSYEFYNHRRTDMSQGGHPSYPTEQAAIDDLSLRALQWARRTAKEKGLVQSTLPW